MIENWWFLVLVASILVTPGPTNTLLAASGVQMGVVRSLLLIPAELMGYWYAISFWALFLNFADNIWPALPRIMQFLSAAYMCWLAVKLWKTSNIRLESEKRLIDFKQLFFATLLNPKALLFAVAILPKAAWDSVTNYLMVMGSFSVVLLPIAALWLMFGSALAMGKIKWLTPHRLQRGSAVVLVMFAVPLMCKVFIY
jgi:threonine/homoserine/homoserine lactone efflux protein